MSGAVKVVYVAGLGHSGSTLLGALLGQLDGFFFAGELASAGRSLEKDDLCGCEEPLASCPTWAAILETAFDGDRQAPSRLAIDHVEGRARGVLRNRLRSHGIWPRSPRLDESRSAFAAVLRAIAETTQSSVVVDSSKWPGYGMFLQDDVAVELSVVHLVRDPRAVVNSRLKSGERRGYVNSPPPAAFAVIWQIWNATIELAWRRGRYLRLRYEDFVAQPQQALSRIAALVDEPATALPFVSADTVELAPTHSVAGNRSRFRTGELRIERDDEWLTAARYGRVDGLAVSALSWPMRARYGYGRPDRPSPRAFERDATA